MVKNQPGLFNPKSREEQACFYVKNVEDCPQKRVELAVATVFYGENQLWSLLWSRQLFEGKLDVKSMKNR